MRRLSRTMRKFDNPPRKYRTRVGMLTIGIPVQARRTTISGSNSIRSPGDGVEQRHRAAQREAPKPAQGVLDGERPGDRPHERLRQHPPVQPDPGRVGAEDRLAEDQGLRLAPGRGQEFRHVRRVVLAVRIELDDVRERPLGRPPVAVPERRSPAAVHGQAPKLDPRPSLALSPERLLRSRVAPVVDDQAREPEVGQRVEHPSDGVLVVVDRNEETGVHGRAGSSTRAPHRTAGGLGALTACAAGAGPLLSPPPPRSGDVDTPAPPRRAPRPAGTRALPCRASTTQDSHRRPATR